VFAKDREGGGAATKISDHLHELDDDAHVWLSRARSWALRGRAYHRRSSSSRLSMSLWAARFARDLRE
jgi:hypothetical protein